MKGRREYSDVHQKKEVNEMMAGTCYICDRPAFKTCLLCGRSACRDHLDDKGFACIKCAPSKKGPNISKGPGEPGGVQG